MVGGRTTLTCRPTLACTLPCEPEVHPLTLNLKVEQFYVTPVKGALWKVLDEDFETQPTKNCGISNQFIYENL